MRIGLLSSIGATATDDDETALQKRLAVALCAGTLPLMVLWSLIYLLVHAPLAAAIPAFYSVFTLVNTALFAWTRNLEFECEAHGAVEVKGAGRVETWYVTGRKPAR